MDLPPSAATPPGFRLLKNDLIVLSLCMLLPPEKRSPRLGMTQNGASHLSFGTTDGLVFLAGAVDSFSAPRQGRSALCPLASICLERG